MIATALTADDIKPGLRLIFPEAWVWAEIQSADDDAVCWTVHNQHTGACVGTVERSPDEFLRTMNLAIRNGAHVDKGGVQ